MKISRTILLLTVSGLLHPLIHAQNSWIDSVRKAVVTQKEDTSKVWTLVAMGNYYMYNEPDTGILRAKQALALAEKLKYDKGIFWSIQSLHNSLHVTGNYTEELNYALKALPVAERLNDLYAWGWSNGMICDSYINLGDYATAMKYIRVIMKNIAEHFPGELFSGYAALVPVYVSLHDYDSAMIVGRKSMELLKAQPALCDGKSASSKYAKSQVYLSLGEAFEANAMYDSALYYYRESKPFSIEMNLKINAMDAYNGIAKIFKERHKYDSSIWYAKEVLQERITKAYPAAKLKAAGLLADVYEAEKITDSSLKYLRIAENLKDSIYSREKTTAFQNALLKEQEKQKEIQAATMALKNRYTMYLLIGLFIILIIIAATVIRNRRIKQLQNIRNSIADDLHDDIGSTLSSISIMNELAKAKSPEALPLLTSIGESTSAIQENMSDLVWTVNPNNDHFENVLQRMHLFATEISDAKNMELEFKTDASLNASRLTMKQRKNLYLFFIEAINNAAKHSGAKKIIINFSKKDHHIELNITDDGNGFNTSATFNGNGMNSLKKRADELNAKYNITSITNEGTAVQLKFRIA
jgi:two-component system sensor histidine kinase UhpB